MQTPNYYPATRYGGPIRSCHGLASALVRLGCEVDVVTSNVDGSEIIDAPEHAPVDIDGVRVFYNPVNKPQRVYASSRMRERFETLIPHADIVQINGMFLWPGVQAARVARNNAVPYIVTPRGMLAPELIHGKSTLVKQSWIRLFERRSLKHALAIHITSQIEAEGIRQQGLDLAPFLEIPNGVDLPTSGWRSDAGPSLWHDMPSGSRVAFLARLDWKKGADIAIEAVKKSKQSCLLLAGPDQIGIRKKLEQKIRDAELAHRIRFVGALGDQEKWRFLAEADVLIVPSLNENFGNTVIEALAVGTPVLCTPEVGAGEWARQIDADCQVPYDADSFAEAIAELLSDKARRERIRRTAPDWIANRLSWDAVAKQFLQFASSSTNPAKRQIRNA